MGIGSVTFSLPHFLTTAYSDTYSNDGNNSSIENICSSNGYGSTGSPRNSVLLQSFASRIDSLGSSSEGELLEKLPGLSKIKSLTKGKICQQMISTVLKLLLNVIHEFKYI